MGDYNSQEPHSGGGGEQLFLPHWVPCPSPQVPLPKLPHWVTSPAQQGVLYQPVDS